MTTILINFQAPQPPESILLVTPKILLDELNKILWLEIVNHHDEEESIGTSQ